MACSEPTTSPSDSQISTIETYKPVLDMKMIALEDRVALACTYLSDGDLIGYLKSQLLQCLKDGDYEGLIITGLGSTASLELLQRCIDVRQDIQTAALLVCRTIESAPLGSASHSTPETIWLHEYRQLLNRWCINFLFTSLRLILKFLYFYREMFMERATLDVDLGQRHRRLLSRKQVALKTDTVERKEVEKDLTATSKLKPSSGNIKCYIFYHSFIEFCI